MICTAREKNDGGERFKPHDASVEKGEILVSGNRVVADNQQVVIPWSEKIRYTSQKMGYHGGGSLQEVMIPVGIYVSGGALKASEGWCETPRYLPEWWHTDTTQLIINIDLADIRGSATGDDPTVAEPARGKGKKAQAAAEVMDDMFASSVEHSSPLPDAGNWKVQFFESPVYKQVKARAGRTMIKEEQLMKLIQLLEANGSQLMMGALIQSLGIPKLRLRGFLAGAQKLLNIDGYPVLSIDRTSETVKLNIESLKTQFELGQ